MAGEGRAVRRIGCRHGASGEGGRQSDKELPMTRSESEANPSAALLRDCYDAPNETVQKKILTRLDKHARAFIGLSPLVMLATAGPEGADCSPRGDAPAFVRVEDDSTLLLPDRRGNNLIASLRSEEHTSELQSLIRLSYAVFFFYKLLSFFFFFFLLF